MVHRNPAAECLRPPLRDTLPERCQQLQRGYADCKRGMVDMRKRFRGNHPMAVVGGLTEEENAKGGTKESPSGGQLYAGKPAVPQKETEIDEARNWDQGDRGI